MTKVFSIFMLLMFSIPSYAHNYIDNPNFDLGIIGWDRPRDFCTGTYEEQSRGTVVVDRVLAHSHARGDSFRYAMKGVPTKDPLYFSVEVGIQGEREMELIVSVYEYQLREICTTTCVFVLRCFSYIWDHEDECMQDGGFIKTCRTHDCNPSLASSDVVGSGHLLTQKKVRINDSKSWHVIASDYPFYKQKAGETSLIIDISGNFLGEEHKEEEEEIFLLNYAQVGSNPGTLGGREYRPKEACQLKEWDPIDKHHNSMWGIQYNN